MPESMPNNDPDITVKDAFDDEADAPVPNSEEAEYRAGYSVILEQVGPFLAYIANRFGEDRCLRMSAGLSYKSLLAIVPLTAIAFSMLAAFPMFSGVRETFQDMLFSNLLPQTADASREYFNKFVQNTTTLSAAGIVALAATAVLLLGTIEADMNAIFRVSRPRPLAPRLLVFWALLTLGPLLLGASFSLTTYIFAATRWMGLDSSGGLFALLGTILPTLMIVLLLAVFYIIIPNRPVSFSAGLIGGLIAGIAFTVLRKLFGWYVISFPTYQNIYGAMSVIPIFLVWMYLSWLIVLVGAIITASISEWQSAGGKPMSLKVAAGMRLVVAVQILAVLHDTSTRDGGAVHQSRILRATGGGGEVVDGILNTLRNARYVERTAANRWILARDPDTLTLYDLYQVLGLGFGEREIPHGDEPWRQRLSDRIDNLKTVNQETLSTPLREILDDTPTT